MCPAWLAAGTSTPTEHHSELMCTPLAFALPIRLGNLLVLRALHLLPEDLPALAIPGEQVIHNHLLRRLAHPPKQREVPEAVRAEHLEHLHRLVPDVLHEVAHVPRHDADVARHVVERPGRPFRREDRDPRAPPEEKGPLVRVRVPVHLADGAGCDEGVGGGDGLRDGEVAGVGDADFASADPLRFLLEHPVREVVRGFLDALPARLLLVDGARLGALEDVLLRVWEVSEDLGCEVEVLGDDGLGCVCCRWSAVRWGRKRSGRSTKPVCQKEC